MAQVFLDLLYSFGNCMSCFPGSPTLKINSRSFKILRLLGEVCLPLSLPLSPLPSSDLTPPRSLQGGFSYVYLVQDTSTSELFALKKIRCPFGAESVAQAMKEVEAYKLFAHSPHIIHSVDYAIASERNDPSSKTVYVLLPYYQRGNLQDMINANLVNHTRFPEKRLMELFLGVCRGLRDMHVYAAGPGERMAMRTDGVDENVQVAKGRKRGAAGADDEDESEQQRPLMTGEEDTATTTGGKERSYAHRDIKPGLFSPSEWRRERK